MISDLERSHRVQLFIRALIWILALLCLASLLPSCRTIKHAPADAALLGGTGASIAAGTMIGGPAGGAVAIVGTIATALATEEMVRPATAPCDPVISAIAPPIGPVQPPWYLSPKYWWGVIVLAFAASFILKYAFSSRFRGHIRSALWAFMSGKIKAGLMYLLAAGGIVHSDAAEKADGA